MPRRDNISPGRVARTERRRKKNEGNEKPKKGLMRILLANPEISLALVGTTLVIILAVVAYLIFSANVQLNTILEQYLNLSARVSDSKKDFTKKKFYITVDENGLTTITISLNTGSEKEDDDRFEEDEHPGGDGGVDGDDDSGDDGNWNTNPSSNGVFEPLSGTSGSYNFNGQELSIKWDNGSEHPAYNGIPASWGWSSSTNATVWHYQNTAAAWLDNFGAETGASSLGTSKKLNQEHNKSEVSNVNGVACLQVCMTRAILECGFTPSHTDGANDVGSNVKGLEGVIVVRDKNTGDYYYIPTCVTDAKAHTYPGGIVQTTCARYSAFSAVYNKSDDSCSDYGLDDGALHDSKGHYDYSDRPATVELEVNFSSGHNPIKDNWEIVDVIMRVG